MTNVQHSKFRNLGSKQVAPTLPQPQVHSVMSPEDEEFIKKMSSVMDMSSQSKVPAKEMLETMPAPQKPLLDDAVIKKELQKKQVLEKLVLFRTPHITEVDIAGTKFRLKLLNTQDNSIVYSMIKDLSQDEQITKTPIILLAAALVDVDGVKLEDAYSGPEEVTDPVKQKYYELCSWNLPVINSLAAAYRKFSDETEKEFSSNFLEKK